jgi:hypothetical protein
MAAKRGNTLHCGCYEVKAAQGSVVMATNIEFPFERGQTYYFHELRAFETHLLEARQRDPEFSKALRNPRGPSADWMRLRNKELVPIKLFGDHQGIADSAQFLLRPAGDPVDADIIGSGRITHLQLTLAAPVWGAGVGPHENSGYQQHQIMAALNENDIVIGYPPFESVNRVATGTTCSVSSEEGDEACRRGLSATAEKKALYDGRGCSLVVFAQDFYLQLLDSASFATLVGAVRTQHRLTFDSTYVLDSHAGFFVELAGPT